MRQTRIYLRLASAALALTMLLCGCFVISDVQENEPHVSSEPAVSVESSGTSSSQEATSPPPDPASDSSPEKPYEPHGNYVWQIDGADATVYIMGTMHVVKPDYQISPEVLELFNSSDALAVECNMLKFDVAAGASEYSVYSDGTNIFDHLSDYGSEYFTEMCRVYDYSPDVLAEYQVFAVSSFFSVSAARLGEYSMLGVDMLLLLMANENLKPILELEDYRDLYINMATLPDDTLERTCILTLTPPEQAVEDLDVLYGVYLSGDDDIAFEYLMSEDESGVEFEEKDELFTRYMLDERNRVMANSIEEYLSGRDTVFVAAGLAHFIGGEESVISLLRAKGYEVVRLDM